MFLWLNTIDQPTHLRSVWEYSLPFVIGYSVMVGQVEWWHASPPCSKLHACSAQRFYLNVNHVLAQAIIYRRCYLALLIVHVKVY